MQPNKSKLAITIGVLLFAASNSSIAATLTPNVLLTTRDDVTLSQVTPMTFGANLFTASGGTCAMNAGNPTEATAQANNAALIGTNYGELTGSGCASGNIATPGVYSISGSTGADVTVTVTPDNTHGDFTFASNSGCIVDYDGAAAGDACLALTSGGSQITTLANTTDAVGTAVDAESIIVVGGTITTVNTLTQSTAYTDSFTVNVVY
jgi:hypothetical protein